MSDALLAMLAAFVPTPIAYQVAAAPQLILQPQSQRGEAAVVFADLCGFTALAERLGQQASSGAEELTHILNGYFEHMITLLELYGGQVVKFSGDALVVLFPAARSGMDAASPAALIHEQLPLAEATLRAVQAALTMRAAMNTFAAPLTSIGRAELNLKVAVAAGEVLAMQVGGVFGRWEYVIAGDALVQLASAAQRAAPGQVLISGPARALVNGQLSLEPAGAGCWQVYATPPAVPAPLPPIAWASLPLGTHAAAEAALRAYVPAAITSRLDGGGSWLAELRPMSVVFAGVGGLDYSAPDAARWLHRFVTAAQEVVYRYEGALNKVAVDDKGTVLLALLGAPPLVHNDDPARALACARDLHAVAHAQGLRMAVGLTSGTVFAGAVGAQGRREYTVIGDCVNLAARLMQAAGAGNTLCDEASAQAASSTWHNEPLPALKVKGKAQPVPVFRPRTALLTQPVALAQPVFGRDAELGAVLHALADVQGGAARVVLVTGEAGSGKTRLAQELRRLLMHCDVTTLAGGVRPETQAMPYRAWHDLLDAVFNVQMMASGVRRLQLLADRALALFPQLRERLPLLNEIRPLLLPESEATAALSEQQRHSALAALLAEILWQRAGQRPLVLLLEDLHLADAASWDALLEVMRQLERQPLLLVLTLRPAEEPAQLAHLRALPWCHEVSLRGLPNEAIGALVAYQLGLERLPVGLTERLEAESAGNPLRIEAALRELRARQPQVLERVVGGGG